MAFTYDLTTNVGRVRLLIADTDSSDYLLEDEEITECLSLEGSNARKAAALCLEIIASSEAMIDRKIKTDGVQTDGPALAVELRARARSLREQAETADATGITFVFSADRPLRGL